MHVEQGELRRTDGDYGRGEGEEEEAGDIGVVEGGDVDVVVVD